MTFSNLPIQLKSFVGLKGLHTWHKGILLDAAPQAQRSGQSYNDLEESMSAATFSIFIQAPPEVVFPFVGDLLYHPAWATDQMKMEARPSGSIRVGNQYRSTTNFKGMVVVAELQIVEYQPPTRFAFTVNDRTGRYTHEFVLHSEKGGTLVERSISNENTDLLSKILTMILMPILIIPESKKALQLLKARVEQA